jgi:polysaccharide export outer membrane protein
MRKLLALASLLLGAFVPAALAQTESLLIGPGDLVQVDVLDTPEMEQQMRVTDTGAITLAYLGEVHVAGETPAAAAADIQHALMDKNVMKHPQVTVRVQEYATQDVSVMGQVTTPGSYAITTPQSVIKVLSMAGGLTSVADRHITIKRRGSGEVISYFLANDGREALADVPNVYPGDTVYVSHGPVVYILGDVGRPGGYTVATNDARLTLMQAITMAGSANKTSTQGRVRLIRKTSQGTNDEIIVHLDAIEKGKEPDVALQANDIVYVPFSWAKNVAMSGGQIAASAAGAAVYIIP